MGSEEFRLLIGRTRTLEGDKGHEGALPLWGLAYVFKVLYELKISSFCLPDT